jgi:hypothetical protein
MDFIAWAGLPAGNGYSRHVGAKVSSRHSRSPGAVEERILASSGEGRYKINSYESMINMG